MWITKWCCIDHFGIISFFVLGPGLNPELTLSESCRWWPCLPVNFKCIIIDTLLNAFPGYRFKKPGVEKAYSRTLETAEGVEAIQRQASRLEEDGEDALPKLYELIDAGEWLARCFSFF